MVLQKLKQRNVRIALVGASNDPHKFGNRIYLELRSKGYDIAPVNPKDKQIEGDRAYTSIGMMEELPDIVNFVVPPPIAMKVAQEAIDLGITHLWFQPGSESDELEELLRKNHDIKYLINSCIMVETR
tara:strand:+ start:131 stop:514 length:384 start_codon:yes stop_codon:yes gene_type:complete